MQHQVAQNVTTKPSETVVNANADELRDVFGTDETKSIWIIMKRGLKRASSPQLHRINCYKTLVFPLAFVIEYM